MKTEKESRRNNVPVVGITGGIGSGKSVVAGVFKRMGAFVIDADVIGKEILESDEGIIRKVIQTFGKEIVQEDGSIDRKKLGNIVFSDQVKLRNLNKIIQPVLVQSVKDEISDSLRLRMHDIVAVDAAIIFEARVESFFDCIIAVTARVEDRMKWLRKRGLTDRETQTRIASQMKQEEKASRSDYVIENISDITALESRAEELYNTILEKYV